MSFTLRVEFMGVCAFVPDEPFFSRNGSKVTVGTPSKVDVLLPNLFAPAVASWESKLVSDLHVRVSHWPTLTYDLSNVEATTLRPDAHFLEPKSGQSRALHILRGEILSFDLPPLRPTFEPALPSPITQPCPLPSDTALLKSSLWWLPQMAEISPQHAFAKASLLSGSLPKDFATRFEIRGGHLSVSDFNRNPVCDWEFRTVARDPQDHLQFGSNPLWNRAVGNRITLERKVRDLTVKLLVKDGSVNHVIELTPRVEGGIVEIGVANVEPETLLTGIEASSIPRGARADVDFEALYAVAASSETSRPVPVKKGPQIGSKTKPCAPASFLGST